MRQQIPVEVQQRLVDTLCEVFYWKNDLRNFLASVGIPQAVLDKVYVRLRAKSKRPVLYSLITDLMNLPDDQGISPLNRMLEQLSQWTDFGASFDPDNPEQAQKAVVELAVMIDKYDLDVSSGHEAKGTLPNPQSVLTTNGELRVFISYSRQDVEFANTIAAALRNRNAEVFLDYEKLEAGSFMKQLGYEIESRDAFLLIISPRSVQSQWVQAELAWAFRCKKKVIPLLLEEASMTDIFVVVGLEQVDFSHWKSGKPIDDAVRKLARLLNLSSELLRQDNIAEKLPQPPKIGDEGLDREFGLAFSSNDITDLFIAAAEIADEDPEQAVYLYHRVLELDPDHADGYTKGFVERQEQRLRGERVRRLFESAEAHIAVHEWHQAKRNAEDVLLLNPTPDDKRQVQRIINRFKRNMKCAPLYEQAVIAAARKQFNAVRNIMSDIKSQCPEFGDPEGILAADVDLNHMSETLYGKVEGRWKVGEDGLTGDAGIATGDGAWSITTPDPKGRGVFGPYRRLEPNKYRVIFRMKVTDNSGEDGRLVTIDVVSQFAQKYFAQRTLTVGDFHNSNKYQDFYLDFNLEKPDENFEFRIRTNPVFQTVKTLVIDYIELRSTG